MRATYAAHRTSSLSFFVAPAANLSNPYDTAIQLKWDGRYTARIEQGSRVQAVEGMKRMRGRTRGGSPARSVVAGGAGGQRLSRGWTRRVFCRTSFALSTPICPLLSSPLAADLQRGLVSAAHAWPCTATACIFAVGCTTIDINHDRSPCDRGTAIFPRLDVVDPRFLVAVACDPRVRIADTIRTRGEERDLWPD